MDFNDLLDDIEIPVALDERDLYPLHYYRSVDLPVVQGVRAKIIAEPERHYQGAWGSLAPSVTNRIPGLSLDVEACGTSYCAAGWAGALTRTAEWIGERSDAEDGYPAYTSWEYRPLPLGGGGVLPWDTHGAAVMGLPNYLKHPADMHLSRRILEYDVDVVFVPIDNRMRSLFYGSNSRETVLSGLDYLIEAGKLAQGITYVGRHYALAQS